MVSPEERREILRQMVKDAEDAGLYDQPEVSTSDVLPRDPLTEAYMTTSEIQHELRDLKERISRLEQVLKVRPTGSGQCKSCGATRRLGESGKCFECLFGWME